MKTLTRTIALLFILITIISCKKETREKLKKAKQGISNTTTIVKNAKEAQKNIEKLKDATQLTNEQLKEWLPESLNDMKRTGFKAGQAMYANLASIEGKYDTPEEESHIKNDEGERITNPDKKSFKVQVMDGAGPTGSMMITSLNMMSKMDFEEENEYHHKKTVNVGKIRAIQTYKKQRNKTSSPKTDIQFVYKDRFGVIVNSTNMSLEETWKTIIMLDLDKLVKKAS